MQVIVNPDLVSDGKIFTIGPDNPVKISDYAAMIAAKLNWQGQIHWNTKPPRPGEIYWLNSDNQLITEVLGWKPVVDLDTGLDKTIEIWRNKLCK